ncbi:TPA_asm: nucleoprotein [Bombay duck fish bornavirus]|uniref:Nucleoprotein n=1 Tax=Bombay duck fish bornavirus TaxID=3067899 RepID=A0AA48PAP9_9MONO|nr:TPA_asm: nucleoprotein [Bombay duck fish bornavirus]
MDQEIDTLEIDAPDGGDVRVPPPGTARKILGQLGADPSIEMFMEKTTGGVRAAGITLLIIVFPSLASLFQGITTEARDEENTPWYRSEPRAPIPAERLYVIKATFFVLFGLIKGAAASMDQASKRFSAMLAGMEMANESPSITTKFSVPEVVSYLTMTGAKQRILRYLFVKDHPEFGQTARHMLTQLQMVAKYGGMTTYEVIEEFLSGDMTAAHLLPGVGKEAVAFKGIVQQLQERHPLLFPYLKVLGLEGHELLNSTAFPALTKVAMYAKREQEGSFKSYSSTKALSNSACRVPESDIKDALKNRKRRSHVDPEDTAGIKRVCGFEDDDIRSLASPKQGDLQALMALLTQHQAQN